jgi:hypothetical protein
LKNEQFWVTNVNKFQKHQGKQFLQISMTQTINFFKKFNIFKNNLKGAITIREL